MRCPLCQYEFDEAQRTCHAACPLASIQGCHLICCPNCGYQMVDEKRSNVARLLRLVIPIERRSPPPVTDAPDLPERPGA